MRQLHLRLFAFMALLLIASLLLRPPDVLAPLTHPITFGCLLAAIAIGWSDRLLTRSSTPFRTPRWASTEP